MYKKSLLFLLLMAFSAPLAMTAQDKGTNDAWDFVTSFTTSTGRQHAVACDGEFIYTAAWGKSSTVLSMFYKYDLEGNFIEEFDVEGVTNSDNFLRDMTYDGQYFYGCDAHSGKVWCYDLPNKTLVSANTITTNMNELGICTYDPHYDAFWVGQRATGISPNLLLDLKLISRNGAVLKTATAHNLGGHTVHGSGYFVDENGTTHLYLFCVEGFTAHVFDYDIEADNLNPNYIFDFSVTPGWGAASSAGGAFIGEYNGTTCFFGDVDKSPNLIGIYALGDFTPIPPTPPTGDVFYDFEDGVLHWTTIDADGDGYNWGIINNWGSTDNRMSANSASRDELNSLALSPDNYLVSPFKLDYEEVSFIARVQDAAFPNEHIGIAVSTTGNTDASDFTTIWETTLTAKTPGAWDFYTVDLRAYQGQEIWVAFRHFNSYDQFSVNVDDITLHRTYDAVSDVTEVATVAVYPSPAVNHVTVECGSTVSSYELYSLTGALLRRQEVGLMSFDVDVEALPAGAYLLKLNAEGQTLSRRFVKQ